MSKKDREKYIACIVLHALGDTIGYKNGEWEFNYDLGSVEAEFSDKLLYDFIKLGGVNDIDLNGWLVSDDTIMHKNTCEILLEDYKDVNDFCDRLSKRFIENFVLLHSRHLGNTITHSLNSIKNGIKWNALPYNQLGGGSGGSMRASVIGLAFNGENNRDKLIKYSIEACRITNNSVIGYLGGMVSALFTAYAIEGINMEEWVFKLIDLLEGDKIENYIKSTRDHNFYLLEIKEFIFYWKKYIEKRFIGKKFKESKALEIPSVRTIFFTDNFRINKNLPGPGWLGLDSVIFAYDSLLCARDKWQTLVVYSMIHLGDSDTTGCIAASWYGALYGFNSVPKNNIKYLEFKDELYDLGKKIFNKYKIENK
jgi:ADP-ribosylarginine hydrolase